MSALPPSRNPRPAAAVRQGVISPWRAAGARLPDRTVNIKEHMMDSKSFANGNGSGPGMRPGSPVPKYLLSTAVVDAKAMTATFWDFM